MDTYIHTYIYIYMPSFLLFVVWVDLFVDIPTRFRKKSISVHLSFSYRTVLSFLLFVL
jgi:hypothetical protein